MCQICSLSSFVLMCKRTPGGREPTSVFLVLFFDFIELTIHNKS